MKKLRLKQKQRQRPRLVISSTDPIPHDRRGMTELPKNAKVAPIEVDDPLEPGAKILAFRNIETDPLGWLKSHGVINCAQYEGGRKWQYHYEILEGGVRSFDYQRPKVDGGRVHEPLTDARNDAALFLKEASRLLGIEGDAIIRDCLVGRMLPSEIAAHRGKTTQRDRDFFNRRLKECLETLAVLGGFAMENKI